MRVITEMVASLMFAPCAMSRVLAPLYPPWENRVAAELIIRRRVSATAVSRIDIGVSEDRMGSAKVRRNGWPERLEIGNIDLDGHTLHDQLERKYDSGTILVTQNNSFHPRKRTAADSGSFTYC